MNGHLRAAAAGLALTLAAFGAAACSDETEDKVGDAADAVAEDAKDAAGDLKEDAEDVTGQAGARAAAEDLRARVKSNDTANEEGARSVAALEESAADVAGDPEISGIDDGDGDGLDDDGRVQVTVGDQSACLILPETGEDTTVENGEC